MMESELTKPVVSVLCLTYNQEDYIANALEGFVSQETDFSFEVLVHDDASTDGTPDIVHDYAARYPNIIKPIFQTENQYSQNIPITKTHLMPRALGDYIAVCEGDDYWIDPKKLQKQYAFMSKNQDYACCFHQAIIIDGETGQKLNFMGYGDSAFNPDAEYIISHWSVGGGVPTASIFYKKDLIERYYSEWDFDKPAGDFPQMIYFSTKGKVHYDPMVGSCYRYRAKGSWTNKQRNDDVLVKNASRWISMLDNIDLATNGTCHDAIMAKAGEYAQAMVLIEGRVRPENKRFLPFLAPKLRLKYKVLGVFEK